MSLADLLTAAATGIGSGGIGVALIQATFNRGGARAKASVDAAQAEAIQHQTWLDEAHDAYARAKQECADCRTELAGIRRELADVRQALILRADVIDELLPYVKGLPDDKMLELRATNRTVRLAAYRVDFDM